MPAALAALLCACAQQPAGVARDNPRDPGGSNWHPPVIVKVRDTFVAQTATVTITVTATDTNPGGAVERYYWDIGADGWDDFTAVPEYRFSNPSGGPMTVLWAARDNDGVMTKDTFIILFNRPPANPEVSAPVSDQGWVSFNWSTCRGTLPLTMSAGDPDLPCDTIVYTLFTGLSAGSLTQVYSGKDTVFNLPDVDSSATVYWKLAARDLLGDSAVDSGSCLAPAAPFLFFEDFEGACTGWTLSGDWQVGTPSGTGPSTAYEGNRCAGTIINGNYNNSRSSYLTSPAITIPSMASQAMVSYYEWFNTEFNCDFMSVQLLTAGGSLLSTLRSGISGSGQTWTRRTFNLSSYIGSSLRLRFYFTTDGSITHAGWYIDSLSISIN
jgi:hypothetical protein